jgi:hypothetical protein
MNFKAEIIVKALEKVYRTYDYLKLPSIARSEHRNDLLRLHREDPGIERAIDEGFEWLCRAQDNSLSQDGGVASHYSLIDGWSTSYPETTGYIIPTMIDYGNLRRDESARERARKMLDWLVSIQLSCGGFQGGLVNSNPIVPVTFNTGQILLGLAKGVREFGNEYRTAMCRAADWLIQTQDPDGCWRKFPTPFAANGEKAYETHVAWGLLEAARVEPTKGYAEAALKNICWALSLERQNGWFNKCCLTDPTQPLTHTLGYVLRGLIEAYNFTKNTALLDASRRTANGLLTALSEDGFLPGRLNQNWQGTVTWNCLTGSTQVAICWLQLYQYTTDFRYRDAAYLVNNYIRRTMKVDGPSEIRGGIKGSFPVFGGYGTYQYLSWACKFFVDSHMLEIGEQKNIQSHSKLEDS